MFADLSLKAKLMSMCAALAVLPVVLGGINKVLNDRMSAAYQHVDRVILEDYVQLGVMRSSANRARVAATELGVEGVGSAAAEAARKSIKDLFAAYETADKKYYDVPFADGEKEIYLGVNKVWTELKDLTGRIDELSRSGNPDDRRKLLEILSTDYTATGARYNDEMNKLLSFEDKESTGWVKKAEDIADHAMWISIVVAVTAMLLALSLGYLVSQNLAKTLGMLSEYLAAGAKAVADAASRISDASTESSSSMTETAAALQQTVASIDEVNAMVGKNADNAKRSFEASNVSKKAADRGKGAVGEMLTSIDEIARSNSDIMAQTEVSNQEIASIAKIIAEIGNKTKVINDIVFQTKLLSFNASVEAARAGEHGKGFAVVAEEVGNLAQMSGNAAKDIATMLDESIRKVEKTVVDSKSRMERMVATGREKIETGTVTARRCGEALDEIVRHVGELNHMVNEISTASNEQAQGVQEITKALSQIDQSMQQTSTVAGELANAGEDLTQQAVSLDGLVRQLVQTVHGTNGVPAQAAASEPALTSRPHAAVLPLRKNLAPKFGGNQYSDVRRTVGSDHDV